jgi:hypothetical protein
MSFVFLLMRLLEERKDDPNSFQLRVTVVFNTSSYRTTPLWSFANIFGEFYL